MTTHKGGPKDDEAAILRLKPGKFYNNTIIMLMIAVNLITF